MKNNKYTILLLEDEYLIAMDIARMLENRGFFVPDILSSGVDALNKINEINPDLIVVDIVLSGDMDGITFVENIQKGREIPVIYITAHTDDKTLSRVKMTTPCGLLFKPINNKELYSAIEIALHKHNENIKNNITEISCKDVFNNAESGILLFDTDGKLIMNNMKIASLLDYNISDFQKIIMNSPEPESGNSPLLTLIHPNDKAIYNEKINKLFLGNKDEIRIQTRFRRNDGTYKWGEIIATRITDSHDKIQYILFIIIDITEQKESEKSIMHVYKFDETISKISSYYVLISDFDEATNLALSEIGTFTEADRTYIILINENSESIQKNYHWKSDPNKSVEIFDDKHYLDLHNCWSEMLLRNQNIYIDDAKNIPKNAITEKKLLQKRDISSLLIMPLYIDEVYIGFIGFDNIMKSGTWRLENIALLRILSDIICNALKRKRMEDRIRTSLGEKEILLKEIHHRVKNNMQIISSLLTLQSHHLRDEKDKELFINTQNRVRSMALVHEMLYQSADIARIDFSTYISEISHQLFSTYSVDKSKITLIADVNNVVISLDRAIPCALIINELISNALKYAFSSDEKGSITIQFSTKDNNHTLIISDNGKGFPNDFDINESKSLGLQIVKALTSQLLGTLKMEVSDGSTFIITFPV